MYRLVSGTFGYVCVRHIMFVNELKINILCFSCMNLCNLLAMVTMIFTTTFTQETLIGTICQLKHSMTVHLSILLLFKSSRVIYHWYLIELFTEKEFFWFFKFDLLSLVLKMTHNQVLWFRQNFQAKHKKINKSLKVVLLSSKQVF